VERSIEVCRCTIISTSMRSRRPRGLISWLMRTVCHALPLSAGELQVNTLIIAPLRIITSLRMSCRQPAFQSSIHAMMYELSLSLYGIAKHCGSSRGLMGFWMPSLLRKVSSRSCLLYTWTYALDYIVSAAILIG
jgi:hypothetical protein